VIRVEIQKANSYHSFRCCARLLDAGGFRAAPDTMMLNGLVSVMLMGLAVVLFVEGFRAPAARRRPQPERQDQR